MPRHEGLPRPGKFALSKTALLDALVAVDKDKEATARVLKLENAFREKIKTHVAALPTSFFARHFCDALLDEDLTEVELE